MLAELCKEVNNYFTSDEDKIFEKFIISGGSITPLDLLNGQYFRIIGSTLNDGIYQFPASDLVEEEFEGAVWAMKVPPAFIALADEIKAWVESDEAKPTALTSESFGGYSYSKATDATGKPLTWQGVFAKKLNQWRKL